ncbi:MAG: hypothetical protein ABI906_09515 [Pseudomonadota bacterium]
MPALDTAPIHVVQPEDRIARQRELRRREVLTQVFERGGCIAP